MGDNTAKNMKVHVMRLHPDQEVLTELKKFIHKEQIHAGSESYLFPNSIKSFSMFKILSLFIIGVILSCVGSVKNITLRFAHRHSGNQVKTLNEHLEVVSLGAQIFLPSFFRL